ncbi:sulfur carrier protein ThiS [Niallia sp. 01092]|uniref:sulfur carrier protein ThiS n=1 Tax=unclassified Niallia TaxID=2837522 RepID=UPI003FD02B5D
MTIRLNGKSVTLPDDVNTIADLLALYELQNRIVVVELNKDIMEKDQYASSNLSEGDTVELIHFVGGG